MDSEDKDKQPQVPGAPGSLPVVEQKTFLTHTMEDDVQKAKGQGYVPERKEAEKPFTRNIPPPAPPVPPAQNDPFRESIGEKPFERDQPFPIAGNAPEAPDTEKKFQIYVPKKKRGPNALTLMLIVVLVLLLSGGGLAYYWFFMKEAAPAPAQITPPPTPEPVPTQPVPEPEPAPEPQPETQPVPTPEPVIIIEPPVAATSTEPIVEPAPAPVVEPTPAPVVAPPPPVVAEPELPQPLIAVDRTVIISIATLADTDAYAKIALENAKIAEDKIVVRYAFKLSTDAEKRFLTQKESASLLKLTVPAGYWGQSVKMEIIGYKNLGSFRYGFVSSITNKTTMHSVAGAWEKTVVDDLKPLYVEKAYVKPSPMVFSSNTYLDFTKRFINMPAPDVSLDWAVSPAYFVIATSKDMIFAVLDKTKVSQTGTSSATSTSPGVPSY